MSVLTALLTALTAWCLWYGKLEPPLLYALCAVLALAVGVLGWHRHDDLLSIDRVAQRSRLNQVNPALKTWGVLCLLFLCLMAPAQTGLLLAGGLLCLSVFVGGVRLHDYIALLCLPISFLLLGSLAILVDWSQTAAGVLNLPLFGGWLCVSEEAQARTLLLLCRAIGALSCLYLLSLSTPMGELIGVLRRAHVPAVVTELMYLIYRYIFLLFETHRTMREAAESRLGFHSFPSTLRTTGTIYASLLAQSYRKAGACFDAMESRGYEGELCFLEKTKPLRTGHVCAAAILFAAALLSAAWR